MSIWRIRKVKVDFGYACQGLHELDSTTADKAGSYKKNKALRFNTVQSGLQIKVNVTSIHNYTAPLASALFWSFNRMCKPPLHPTHLASPGPLNNTNPALKTPTPRCTVLSSIHPLFA